MDDKGGVRVATSSTISLTPVANRLGLRTIATGLRSVESMYEEMRALEMSKDMEIAELRRALDAAVAKLRDRDEEVAFLVATTERLERKLEKREAGYADARCRHKAAVERIGQLEQTVVSLETHVAAADAAARAAARSATQAACETNHIREAAVNALASAEIDLVSARTQLFVADAADLSLDEWAARMHANVAASAEVAFRRFHLCFVDAHSTSVATADAAVRRIGQDIARSALKSAVTASLVGPLLAGLRAIVGAPHDATAWQHAHMLVHRCFAACERSIIQCDTG